MCNIPSNLYYKNTHEWVANDEKSCIYIVGITDYAVSQLGDIVYVELPSVGNVVDFEQECAVVESVKSASDIYSPISGEIVEVNSLLIDSPELLNTDPYKSAWLFKIKNDDIKNLQDKLLNTEQYKQLIKQD